MTNPVRAKGGNVADPAKMQKAEKAKLYFVAIFSSITTLSMVTTFLIFVLGGK